jgi:hypothetical protein
MLPAKFGSIWPSTFRGEDFLNISQSETRIALNDYLPLKFASVSFYCQVSDTGSVA